MLTLSGGREYRYDQGWQSYVTRSGLRTAGGRPYNQAWANDPAVWMGGRIGLGQATEKEKVSWPWIVGFSVLIGIAGLFAYRDYSAKKR